ncbi:MAG: low specificity L-threonine aldolase [Candidatus Sericytochromatia bacterium]|nr:low specificity L-threonine aldolase [Candidatus Sericytochromatia bacterium]
MKRNFASDNNSGIHPNILKAISECNIDHVSAYGSDIYTERAVDKFKEYFGENIDVYFVINGTAANVLGLSTITNSYNSIICSEYSHINVDECGAPEKFIGCKLINLPTEHAKITLEQIKNLILRMDDQHSNQAKVISLTQSTELGTVYSIDEIKNIVDYAHQNKMFVHVDGARISNACVSLKTNFKKMIVETGVDILSFGGTKNGLMLGEAVIFFNRELSEDFKYIRKQGMQLVSKMRFISAQFEAYLTHNLWYENANHSNQMAQLLYEKLSNIPEITITQKVQSNGVFAIIPSKYISILQEKYSFYVWNENTSEVRLMCSFDTTIDDIDKFAELIKNTVKS